MADKKIILTPEERAQLEKEYRRLIDVERPDVIEKLTLARSQGDLSENADYDAARDRQAQIESRISQIEHWFRSARISICPFGSAACLYIIMISWSSMIIFYRLLSVGSPGARPA